MAIGRDNNCMGAIMKQNTKTLSNILLNALTEMGEKKMLWGRKPTGEWVGVNGHEHLRNVLNVVRHFQESGLKEGEQILIMAMNSYAWQVTEHASLLCGLEIIGLETHAQNDYIASVIGQLNVSAVVYYDESQLTNLIACGLGHRKMTVSMNEIKKIMSVQSNLTTAILPLVTSETPATLIFTSGTTGKPKGIRYNHGQIYAAIRGIVENFTDISSTDRTLSWLPMANLFQRNLNLCAIVLGVSVYYFSIPQNVMNIISEVKPTIMIAVPRFFEKVYKNISQKIQWAPQWAQNTLLKLMGSLLRKKMGGKLRFFISGSAKCKMQYLQYFSQIGMPILEAYGMSESVVPLALNSPSQNRMGSVGRPLSCNSVQIGPDGEILVKTPTLASHYLGQENKNLISADGYFSTGDKGRLDEDGYLYVEGRLNDVVKTSTGRKINLNEIDECFASITLAEQAVALAENLPAVCLVLTGISKSDKSSKKTIEKQIEDINTTLPSYAQVRRVIFLEKPLSIEDGTLTNNLKIRRNVLAARCEHELQSFQ